MIRHADDTVTAFDMHCTHLFCPYSWTGAQGSQGVFACPCHGSVFAKDGSVINGPAFVPLHRRATSIDGGDLLIGGLDG